MLPEDPALPVASHLTGPGARPLLETALAAVGGHLEALRQVQVMYHPGRSVTVRYAASVRWPGATEPTSEVLLAGATRDGAPPGTLPLEAGDLVAGVWRYPFDPALPGLAEAVSAEGAARLAGPWLTGEARPRVRSYRPGSRAVVQVRGTGGGEVFLKVLRPADLAGLVERHRLLEAFAPVPEVLATDEAAGVAVLRALPGVDLRERLRRGDVAVPGHRDLLTLLDGLSGAPLADAPPAPGPLASVARHARLLARVVPPGPDAVRRLADQLLAGGDGGAGPLLPSVVHGDLHEAQVRTEGARIVGLLDLDGVGPGDRLDDWATLLGHLSTLALGAGPARGGVEAYLEQIRRPVVAEVGPAELDRRVAAAVLGLATGPFRVQEANWAAATRQRIELAGRWLGRSATGERSLIAAS